MPLGLLLHHLFCGDLERLTRSPHDTVLIEDLTSPKFLSFPVEFGLRQKHNQSRFDFLVSFDLPLSAWSRDL